MIDVGERLKKLRNSRALSQRELAKMAGITNGTISAIEKNTVSPSVSSLKKLLDAIPISLSEFFSMEIAVEPNVFFSADSMTDAGTGGVQRKIMGRVSPEQKLLLMDETFPAGANSGDLMSHEGEETGFVVSGRIEVTVGDEIRVLKPGDGFHFDSETPHRFRNDSNEPCRIICCSTPAKF